MTMNEILPRVVLFDTEENYRNLLPISYTRPVGAFRMGMCTLAERWQAFFPGDYTWLTRPYLQEKFPGGMSENEEAWFIAGCTLANAEMAEAVRSLAPGHGLRDDKGLWAWRGTLKRFEELIRHHDVPDAVGETPLADDTDITTFDISGRRINYVFDIFLHNSRTIEEDYRRLCAGKRSQAPDKSVTVIGPVWLDEGIPSLMIEEGASVAGCTLNVTNGPIYIGRDAQVMEGSCLRGPLVVGPGTRIRMGARIYGGTTFGPVCRIGGEVDNTVVFGYSNKAHDGYLGNAVIGEWCNIGAGANASNLKNDYAKIRIWNYAQRRFMRTDLQFCGLIMGDHSKAAINAMFNTATVVGVGVNFHGAGFPRTFIPSFQNGSPAGFSDVSVDAFLKVAATVMRRRDIDLTDADRRMYEHIYAVASEFKR